MSDQTGRYKWVLKLARITLIAALVIDGLYLALFLSRAILAVIDGDSAFRILPAMEHAVMLLMIAAGLFLAYGLITAFISNVYSAASAAARIGRIESVLSDQNQKIHKLVDLTSLSDQAKSLLFRDRELELMREQVNANLVREDYDTAESFIQRIETGFGYSEEASRLRQDIVKFKQASEQEKFDAAIGTFERVLDRQDWDRATREADRLAQVFGDSDLVGTLPERIRKAQVQHKRHLLEQYGEAVGKNDVDGSIELLQKLDGYLSPQEAAAMQESARDVFKKKLHNLGVQFAIFVNDQLWDQAVATGEEIVRQYPNTRMAQEAQEKMDQLRSLAAQTAGS